MSTPKLPNPPYRTQFLDRSGLVATPWIQFFRQMFDRVGGAIAPTNNELHQTQFDDAGIVEQQAEINSLAMGFWQYPYFLPQQTNNDDLIPPNIMQLISNYQQELSELRETVAQLQQQINDIKQGANL